MNSKLIIAAIACLGLAACQKADEGKKEEHKAAEHQGAEHKAEEQAPAQPAPTAPTSYYEDQNQNVAEQANPAIDSQQETAHTAQAENNAIQVSQQAESEAAAQ